MISGGILEGLGSLIAINERLNNNNRENIASIDHTQDEIWRDVQKELYYVNGVEIYKDENSLNANFGRFLRETDQSLIDYINRNFNQNGFKAAARLVVKDHLFRELNSRYIETSGIRYDFIELNNNEVILFERFECVLTNTPICLVSTAFKISKNNDEIMIQPEDNNVYVMDENVGGLFHEENKSSYNIIINNQKKLNEISQELDDEIFILSLRILLGSLVRTHNIVLPTEEGNHVDWELLNTSIQALIEHPPEEMDGDDVEQLRILHDSYIVPRANEQANYRLTRFLLTISDVFYRVFPSDSYVLGSHYFNGESLASNLLSRKTRLQKHEKRVKKSINQYLAHPITYLAAFLGLPHQCELGETPTFSNLFWRFLDYENDKSPGRNAINYILTLAAIVKNTARFALTTSYNLIRLITEFLPLITAFGCKQLATAVQKKAAQSEGGKKMAYAVLHLSLKGLGYAFDGLYTLLRSVTSPIKSLDAAWDFCQRFKKRRDEKQLKRFFRMIAGVALCLLSISVPLTIATVFFPFLLHFIPAMSVNLPVWASGALKVISEILAWTGSQFVLPILGKLWLALQVSVSAEMAGLALTAGACLTSGGFIADRIIEKLRNKWRTTCYKKPVIFNQFEPGEYGAGYGSQANINKTLMANRGTIDLFDHVSNEEEEKKSHSLSMSEEENSSDFNTGIPIFGRRKLEVEEAGFEGKQYKNSFEI